MPDDREVDVRPLVDPDEFGKQRAQRQVTEAITTAIEGEEIVWLTDGEGGRRLGAIVPAVVAENFVAMVERETGILAREVRAVRGGAWEEAPDCKLHGIGTHEANAIIARPPQLDLPHAHWCGDLQAGHRAFMDALASNERIGRARAHGADGDASLRQ